MDEKQERVSSFPRSSCLPRESTAVISSFHWVMLARPGYVPSCRQQSRLDLNEYRQWVANALISIIEAKECFDPQYMLATRGSPAEISRFMVPDF